MCSYLELPMNATKTQENIEFYLVKNKKMLSSIITSINNHRIQSLQYPHDKIKDFEHYKY